MSRRLAAVSIVVRDYDEALAYYCGVLGFDLIEDTDLGGGKRWVLVAPSKHHGSALLLARASGPDQQTRIGDQTGGRVFLFLDTDDFVADHARYRDAGVRFIEEPRQETYGIVAVFEDMYGNRWDLVKRAGSGRPPVETGRGTVDNLEDLAGEQLAAVAFVRDYVEFHFDGPILRSIANPVVVTGGRSWEFSPEGSGDHLRRLIGLEVESASDETDRLVVRFVGGATVELPKWSPSASPEIAQFLPTRDGRRDVGRMLTWENLRPTKNT